MYFVKVRPYGISSITTAVNWMSVLLILYVLVFNFIEVKTFFTYFYIMYYALLALFCVFFMP